MSAAGFLPTARRALLGLLLATVGTAFLATRGFVGFDAVRVKAVQTPRAAADRVVDVTTTDRELVGLSAPFALIVRLRNDAAAAQDFRIAVDDDPTCTATVTAGATRRIDCVVSRGWAVRPDHRVTIRGANDSFSVEYLELATHHGHSTGVFRAVVLPADAHVVRRPSLVWLAAGWIGLALLLLLPPRRIEAQRLRWSALALTVAVAGLLALVWLLPVLSPYRVALAPWTFVTLALLATISRTWPIVAIAAGVATRTAIAVAIAGERLARVMSLATVRAVPAVRSLWTTIVARRAWLVVFAAAAVTIPAAMHGPRAVGGSDEYGYLSQADLWREGNLRISQPFVKEVPWRRAEWMFSPHGYRPHPDDPSVIVPIYAPGLPMVLAIAKAIGGQEAMFYVVPLSTGLLVLGTYAIGRRLGAEIAGLIAALLVAASPVVLFMSTHLMTDVPVAAVWAWAFYCLLGRSPASAVAAGLLSSLAVLIRPNLAPLAGVLAMRYVLAMRVPVERRRTFALLCAFAGSMLPGIVAVAAINEYLYGSPFSSGYGGLAQLFVWARVPINVRQYLQWFAQAHTPLALAGLVALLVPLPRLWPGVRDRSVILLMAAFVAIVWAVYCAWVIFDAWWFARFLLPSWPFIMLGVGSLAVAAFASAPRWGRPLVVAVVIAVGLFELRFALRHHPYYARDGRRFAAAAKIVRQMTDRNSVIVSSEYSGSIRYYGGRMTMNEFWIPAGSTLDRIVDWHLAHGVRTYVAADEAELPEMLTRFAGNRCRLALERPPIAIYEDPRKMLLFDLTEPRAPDDKPIVVRGPDVGPTATPVPLPRLVYRNAP